MASPVGSSSQRRYSSAAQFSLGLATPGGTPPTNASSSNHLEARLHQLLANFDCGTHSFDRNERETPAEKRLSFGAADGMPVLPTPPGSRRPSFLSGLSLSRPSFGFSSTASSGTSTPTGTAPTTPINASHGHHHLPSGLKMTSTGAFNNSAIQDDELPVDPIRRPRSTPSGIPASGVQSQSVIGGDEAPSMAMHRSNTTPLSGQSGQFALQGNAGDRVFQAVRRSSVAVGEKRHFDPSKEPKLLGLL